MEIKHHSKFKDPEKDLAWFENWVRAIEISNGRPYERITVETELGKTHVWGLNTSEKNLPALVIFPGFRTTPIFWDFDKALDQLGLKMRVFLVETNGQPNLSDGGTPPIRSLGYGKWASELFDKLNLKEAFVAGSSFGGLVCMKLAIVAPKKVKAAFLLNPGCLQTFSLTPKNLFFNLLPIFFPNRKNVSKFLDKAVFSKPNHKLSKESEAFMIDYEVFALTQYKDKTQKPYYMGDELKKVSVDTFLFQGNKDLLFPYRKSIANAKSKISPLKEVLIFENVGHGIETYVPAIQAIGERIKLYLS